MPCFNLLDFINDPLASRQDDQGLHGDRRGGSAWTHLLCISIQYWKIVGQHQEVPIGKADTPHPTSWKSEK